MRIEIDPAMTPFDTLIALEAIARESVSPASMYIEDEENVPRRMISLGLDREMYRAVYPLGENYVIDVFFANGDKAACSHWEPHALYAEGSERFVEGVRQRMTGSVRAADRVRALPLGKCRDLTVSTASGTMVRQLYRAASARRASFALTDAKIGGKLVRVTSLWMISAHDSPIDVVIRFPQGGWMLCNMRSGGIYVSENSYFEAKELLGEILQG